MLDCADDAAHGLGGAIRLAAVCMPWALRKRRLLMIAPGGQAQTLDQQIAALVAEPGVSRDHWGVMATTLDGKPLYSLV